MTLRGLLAALVLALPATAVAAPSPAPWVGFNDISSVSERVPYATAAQAAADAGATSTRAVLDWAWLEPTPGRYAWGVADRLYDAALAHGLRPLIGITGAPRWAWDLSARCPAARHCAFPPARRHLEAYAELVGRLARRYPRVAAIEIGNEPNLAWAWAGGVSPARYTELLATAYRAVKAVAPGTAVLAGGLAPVLTDLRTPGKYGLRPFLRGMFAAGAARVMDGISLHPYPAGTDLAPSFAAVRLALEVRSSAGDDAPLWLTELGLTTTGGTSPADQAAVLPALVRAFREDPDVRGIYVHTLYDDPGNPLAPERGYGLLAADGTPKPAYCALATALPGAAPCPAGVALPAPGEAQQLRWRAQSLLQAAADAARRVHDETGSYAAVTPAALHDRDARLSAAAAPAGVLPGALADPSRIAIFPIGNGLVLCNATPAGRSYCIASVWNRRWGYGSGTGTILATARDTINARTSGW